MLNIKGNLFNYIGMADVVCISTNGFVKKNGACVMGRGCALEAVKRWPNISLILGRKLIEKGNVPIALVRKTETLICSFPVKPVCEIFTGENTVRHMRSKFKIGQEVPGWACKANIDLIIQSATILSEYANKFNWKRIVLPRPGCGAGELSWDNVEPILQEIIDDRFVAVTF